ncbi:MAG TPA: hypothetical protein VGU66_08110 [Candidatus Elarobacter sp.]|nr:hypothetical protein [Candidatus Elarobacter sp.]
MMNMLRGRTATALASLCLLLAATAGPASAVLPEDIANDGMGLCANCKANTQTKTGNATGGYVHDNGNGYSNTAMSYVPPNDGTQYSGTVSITINDANGNNLYNYSGSISDTGNGATQYAGLDDIYIPAGANIFIKVTESNWAQSFAASWHLQNYQP